MRLALTMILSCSDYVATKHVQQTTAVFKINVTVQRKTVVTVQHKTAGIKMTSTEMIVTCEKGILQGTLRLDGQVSPILKIATQAIIGVFNVVYYSKDVL